MRPNEGLPLFASVYQEKYVALRLYLQYNHKQQRLNFITVPRRLKYITEVLLFMDMELLRGRGLGGGGASRKILEIPGGRRSTVKPTGMEILGVGGQTKKTCPGGYGYFLEPHISQLFTEMSMEC